MNHGTDLLNLIDAWFLWNMNASSTETMEASVN